MASVLIHICVAKKVKEKMNLKVNEKDYILGSMAPDIAKQIGENKAKSHFIFDGTDIPNIKYFLDKYDIETSFDLGYLVHLYTDKYFYGGFLDKLVSDTEIKLLDGTIVPSQNIDVRSIIYNDYTNINIDLIDSYDLDLSIFYEDFIIPKSKIEEIPLDKLDILLEKIGIIIENTKKEPAYIFDMYTIHKFIEECTNRIIGDLSGRKIDWVRKKNWKIGK